MRYMGLKICMGDKTHRYYKHTKFHQNPRGDPKFLVDMTWNDPSVKYAQNFCPKCFQEFQNFHPLYSFSVPIMLLE